jgi:hypothetical protein
MVAPDDPHRSVLGSPDAVLDNGVHPARDRILEELRRLREGGQVAAFRQGTRPAVLYAHVPSAGAKVGLPPATSVLVPVPDGYPAALIDLAGLPLGSPFLPRLKGGPNPQGVIELDGISYQLASYHPHTNGGGPPWDPQRHGFHTYLDHLLSWLSQLT